MDVYFPYERMREFQKDIIEDISAALEQKKSFIMHAPTGLGKTAAALAPALTYALKNGLTVFFLTSRHTQHKLAVDTLRDIKNKHGIKFNVSDLIGKKWLCTMPGIDKFTTSEFGEFCKVQKEDDLCEFYNNTRKKNKETVIAKVAFEELMKEGPCQVERLVERCKQDKLCPYEIAMMLASKADVIIGDYFHLFSPGVRETFLNRTEKVLEKAIIIVDEGHNLPSRIKDLATEKISNFSLRAAIKECEELNHKESAQVLRRIMNILAEYNSELPMHGEKIVDRDEFIKKAAPDDDYEKIITDLLFIGDEVRETKRQSYTGSIAGFLSAWRGADEGFVRIVSKQKSRINEPLVALTYRCLDPSVISKSVIEASHSTIIMSGTLKPTSMYADLLGFPEGTFQKEYKSPFDKSNKLSLIIPETTTKFTRRSPEESKKIADILCKALDAIPGNTAIFFPSYSLRDEIQKQIEFRTKKTVFTEEQGLSKADREETLDRFKSYKDTGAVLLGVSAGSFGEGIDLPGTYLQAVIIVGLPLQRPDLETKAIIDYYNKKFGKGWEYGYVYPAINLVFQNEGRLIRTETDRGAVIFLDERYSWSSYMKCFPEDVRITKLYVERLREFFDPKLTKK